VTNRIKAHGALLLAATLAVGISLPAFAQEVTREEAQKVMTKVNQDVMHAQFSSTGYGNVQKLYVEGQTAYFKGNYAEAVKKFNEVDAKVKNLPNDYHGESGSHPY
jgi:outer membrane protein assembly factor BamD (BamD/ComL family)